MMAVTLISPPFVSSEVEKQGYGRRECVSTSLDTNGAGEGSASCS